MIDHDARLLLERLARRQQLAPERMLRHHAFATARSFRIPAAATPTRFSSGGQMSLCCRDQFTSQGDGAQRVEDNNCLRLRTDIRGQPDLPTVVGDNSALRFRGHAATRCSERSPYKPINA